MGYKNYNKFWLDKFYEGRISFALCKDKRHAQDFQKGMDVLPSGWESRSLALSYFSIEPYGA